MGNHVHLIAVPERANSLADALGRTHSEYALTLNRVERRSGHLWQNRFFSCVLGPSHWMTALAYVDLNPVRARLVARAWDWPWSSALAHSDQSVTDPVLAECWREYAHGWDHPAWRQSLEEMRGEQDWDSLRRATYTGEPCGSDEFVNELERKAARRLRVLKRGWPPKKPAQEDGSAELAIQGVLFPAG